MSLETSIMWPKLYEEVLAYQLSLMSFREKNFKPYRSTKKPHLSYRNHLKRRAWAQDIMMVVS
jgi:hypothetical protein